MTTKPKPGLLLAVFLTVVSISACAKLNENQAVEKVVTTVRNHKFLAVPEECAQVTTTKKTAKYFAFDVREWHHGPNCPGDTRVAPRLFSFVVDRKTGAMKTDAADPARGEMLPVSPR